MHLTAQVSPSVIACKDCRHHHRQSTASSKGQLPFQLPRFALHRWSPSHELHQAFGKLSSKPNLPTPRARKGGNETGLTNEGRPINKTLKIDNSEEPLTSQSSDIEFALKALSWYKTTVSPLLPRSCRFLPTCSSYSVQAYKEYGNLKGSILTAWRLMRCNPLNLKVKYQGKYDPPSWPPVGLEWIFRHI